MLIELKRSLQDSLAKWPLFDLSQIQRQIQKKQSRCRPCSLEDFLLTATRTYLIMRRLMLRYEI